MERNRPAKEQKLLDWVKGFPPDGRTFSMIIDPRLRNQYSLASARNVAKLAECCLVKNQKDRPTMSQIVSVLKEAIRDSEEASSSGTADVGSGRTNKPSPRSY